MRISNRIASIVFLLLLTACATTQPIPVVTTQPVAAPKLDGEAPLIQTSMGEFMVISTRLVDEARGTQAPEGFKYLLVGLARPGGEKLVAGQFSFEDFQKMTDASAGQIYVIGSDGSTADYGTMGGWLDMDEDVADDFVMGFLVTPSDGYTLHWADNPELQLTVETMAKP